MGSIQLTACTCGRRNLAPGCQSGVTVNRLHRGLVSLGEGISYRYTIIITKSISVSYLLRLLVSMIHSVSTHATTRLVYDNFLSRRRFAEEFVVTCMHDATLLSTTDFIHFLSRRGISNMFDIKDKCQGQIVVDGLCHYVYAGTPSSTGFLPPGMF